MSRPDARYTSCMRNALHITLPAPLRDWVERQVARKGYGSAGDYVLDLLRQEQLQEVRDRVDAKLALALESGPASDMTPQDWQDVRREGQRRVAAKRRPAARKKS